jgi:sugar transferase (PEP-CTERM/EpsH1 system associated)
MRRAADAPLIAHIVYSFHTGGLENGLVNLINHLPRSAFRHVIVSLTTHSPDFCARLAGRDVGFVDLHKPKGHGFKLYPKLFRLFRELTPAIVHTRNLAALEAVVPAFAARVPIRIHGEHGWDVSDPDGRSLKYRLVRRLYRPFVHRYVALSGQLERYLVEAVGVPTERIARICNGVDVQRFHPTTSARAPLAGSPFNDPRYRIIGTVGRLQAIKDQTNLLRGFAELVTRHPGQTHDLRLILVGDGPMRGAIEAEVAARGLADKVWLAGERADVADVMRSFDVFVLPSRAEGISNTILEAMASGLPVVATDVGGNGELVEHGRTGLLVPASEPQALAEALVAFTSSPERMTEAGQAARQRAVEQFSIERMVEQYQQLYLGNPVQQRRTEGVKWC